jgi:5-formyltetrahydrofolate cyclo-ligase
LGADCLWHANRYHSVDGHPTADCRAVSAVATILEWNAKSLMETQDVKKSIREQAHANRRAQENKDALSQAICDKFSGLPEFDTAKCVLAYIDVRTEVRTRDYLLSLLASGKRVAVPYCVDHELELFELASMDELAVGMYKILEPRPELRDQPAKQIDVREVDLVMVPGVAFDRRGARMGHGFGYYDKLLEHARSDAPLVALAFECQLFPEIPTQSHDIFMDKIITEKAIYDGKGR